MLNYDDLFEQLLLRYEQGHDTTVVNTNVHSSAVRRALKTRLDKHVSDMAILEEESPVKFVSVSSPKNDTITIKLLKDLPTQGVASKAQFVILDEHEDEDNGT